MTINERVKVFRKSLKLNQKDFGQKIGFAQTGVSSLENPANGVTERTIRLICDTFNVNETWLRTGEGDMFKKKEPTNIMDRLKQELELDEKDVEIIKAFVELTPEQRRKGIEFMEALSENMTDLMALENQDTKKDESQDPSNQGTARPPVAETRTIPHDYSLTDDVTHVTGSLSKLTDGVKSLSKLTGKLPANCQQVNAPMPASCQPSTDSDKTRTGFGQDSDNSYNARPAGLSDKEWALVLMSREEEERGSLTSSSKKSERA